MAKSFSWSFSKAKAYDTCPKRFYEVELAKNYADSTEQLLWGNEVHGAFKQYLLSEIPSMPSGMTEWQKWADQIKTGPGQLLVEQKLAMTKDFQPCAWFAPGAWVRAIVDVARLDGPVAFVRDWKTGKVQHDSRQLMISTQVLFAHHPQLQRVKTEFVWLKDDCVTPESFSRSTIAREWPPLLNLVSEMDKAAQTMTYPPKPSGLCIRYCPVISCPFHGKGARR